MNQKYFIHLTEEERSQLKQLISSGTAPARRVRRAHILLKSDCGDLGPNWTYQAIQEAFDVSSPTITAVRRAYEEDGLEAAINRKPPDREYVRRLDGAGEARLLALAGGKPPEGHKRWTLRLLRDRLIELGYVDNISHETVRRTLNKTKPSLG